MVENHNLASFRVATFRVFDMAYTTWHKSATIYKRVSGAKNTKGATRKPTKWWLFRVFEWRPFAPPHESTRHFMRCVFGYCLSYLCMAGRKVSMREPAKRRKSHWGEVQCKRTITLCIPLAIIPFLLLGVTNLSLQKFDNNFVLSEHSVYFCCNMRYSMNDNNLTLCIYFIFPL